MRSSAGMEHQSVSSSSFSGHDALSDWRPIVFVRSEVVYPITADSRSRSGRSAVGFEQIGGSYQRRHQGLGSGAQKRSDFHVVTAQSRSVCSTKLITQVATTPSTQVQPFRSKPVSVGVI